MSATKLLTVLFVLEEGAGRILLGMKKRGFGKGKWNGFGGKVEAGETIEAAAQRELKEEAEITAVDPKHQGTLFFEFEDDYGSFGKPLEVHVFCAGAYTGCLVETEEMKPQWFSLDAIPYDSMWIDDRYWFPYLLAGTPFCGKFQLRSDKEVISHKITTGSATLTPST